MSRTRVYNPELYPVTLPMPYAAILGAGEYGVVNATLAVFTANVGQTIANFLQATDTEAEATIAADAVVTALAAAAAPLDVNEQLIKNVGEPEEDGDVLRWQDAVRSAGTQTGLAGAKSWTGAHTFAAGLTVTTVPMKNLVGTVAAILALASPAAGQQAFATNGCAIGQSTTAGTGVLAVYNGTNWVIGNGSTLTA